MKQKNIKLKDVTFWGSVNLFINPFCKVRDFYFIEFVNFLFFMIISLLIIALLSNIPRILETLK